MPAKTPLPGMFHFSDIQELMLCCHLFRTGVSSVYASRTTVMQGENAAVSAGQCGVPRYSLNAFLFTITPLETIIPMCTLLLHPHLSQLLLCMHVQQIHLLRRDGSPALPPKYMKNETCPGALFWQELAEHCFSVSQVGHHTSWDFLQKHLGTVNSL